MLWKLCSLRNLCSLAVFIIHFFLLSTTHSEITRPEHHWSISTCLLCNLSCIRCFFIYKTSLENWILRQMWSNIISDLCECFSDMCCVAVYTVKPYTSEMKSNCLCMSACLRSFLKEGGGAGPLFSAVAPSVFFCQMCISVQFQHTKCVDYTLFWNCWHHPKISV